MLTLKDVFNETMALIDELGEQGQATENVEDYRERAPGIVSGLISEIRILTGSRRQPPQPESMEDPLLGVEDSYASGPLAYGLAAALLVEESPSAASFYQQRYEEMRDKYLSRLPAELGGTVDIYGGIEYGRFGRW